MPWTKSTLRCSAERQALALVFAALLLLSTRPALAALGESDADSGQEVSITLSGGEVVGKVRGEGKASVVATVKNLGLRYIKGVRIAAAYNTQDENPGADGDWMVHEFVFEPPLKPGGQSTLRFSDEGAAEYVALELRRVVYSRGVSFNGELAKQQDALIEEDGTDYMSTRDFMSLIGGKLGFEAKTGYVLLERDGVTVKLKKGKDSALVGKETIRMEHAPIELDSRSYIAIEETAALFGLSATVNSEENLIDLSS